MTAITDRLDGAGNVLLESDAMGSGRGICTDLLVDGRTDPSVLFVTYTRSADECVEQVRATGADPSTIGVVTIGDASPGSTEGVQTESVSSPSDLTGLGIKIGNFLANRESPTVCFDSITAMLQYVEAETAYEFLHAISGQLYASDARAHFHVDPGAHDEQALAGITSLFDAAVTVDGEDVTVRSRDLLQ